MSQDENPHRQGSMGMIIVGVSLIGIGGWMNLATLLGRASLSVFIASGLFILAGLNCLFVGIIKRM